MATTKHSNSLGNLITEKVIVGHCSAYGYIFTIEGTRFCKVERTAKGRYTVTFDTPHPDGKDYEVIFGAEEDILRDTPTASVERGSKESTGFKFRVTEGDNGLSADTYSNSGWSFEVLKTVNVVVGKGR